MNKGWREAVEDFAQGQFSNKGILPAQKPSTDSRQPLLRRPPFRAETPALRLKYRFNPYDGWRYTALYSALCAKEAEMTQKNEGFNSPPLGAYPFVNFAGIPQSGSERSGVNTQMLASGIALTESKIFILFGRLNALIKSRVWVVALSV